MPAMLPWPAPPEAKEISFLKLLTTYFVTFRIQFSCGAFSGCKLESFSYAMKYLQ